MKKLQSSNDETKFSLVDDDVFETIQEMGLKFSIDKRENNGYFRSTTEIKLTGMTEKKRLQLHHFVLILKTSEEPAISVDHIDRNPLNNQFENLRLATVKQQNQHKGKRKDNTSGLIGISHHHDKRGNGYDYWFTHIQKPDGKQKHKCFPYTPEGKIEAAKFYDKKAREYFGDFCGDLNFPMPSDKDK